MSNELRVSLQARRMKIIGDGLSIKQLQQRALKPFKVGTKMERNSGWAWMWSPLGGAIHVRSFSANWILCSYHHQHRDTDVIGNLDPRLAYVHPYLMIEHLRVNKKIGAMWDWVDMYPKVRSYLASIEVFAGSEYENNIRLFIDLLRVRDAHAFATGIMSELEAGDDV